VNMSLVTPKKRSASTAFPTPLSMALKKNKKYRKGGMSKNKKRARKSVKSSSLTFQSDRSLEYRSKPFRGAAKRRANFEKRVVKAMQSKMPPNNIILNTSAFNLGVSAGTQNAFTSMLWTANGIVNTSDDIRRLYDQVGGLTSPTAGYAYDLHLHTGILEVDICLETSGVQVAQGILDVYTVKCRKDVKTDSVLSTLGTWN